MKWSPKNEQDKGRSAEKPSAPLAPSSRKTTKTGIATAILVRASTAFAKSSNVDPFLTQTAPRHIALVITPDVPHILDEKTGIVVIRSAHQTPTVQSPRKQPAPQN